MKWILCIVIVFTIILEAQDKNKEIITKKDLKSSTDEKNQMKKWGYVYSNSFEKFSPNYITQIQKKYDIICVTGLMFRGTGQIRFEKELINKLQKAKIDYKSTNPLIYPMVTFSSVKDGINLLTRENSRAKAVENLSLFLTTHGFKGVHLDLEGLPADYSKALGVFLDELKEELSSHDIKLTFALFPQIDFSDLRLFHKPEDIAKSIDEIVLMSYDYHNIKTKAGCVSTPSWTRKNLDEVLKHFSAEKIWLGLPAYGYEWAISRKKVNVVSAREAQAILNRYVSSRDESSCVKIQKSEKGKESIIYYADQETRKILSEIAKESNLIGTAVWRIGLEED